MAGNFYRVRCPDCDGEQIIFGKASTTVSCAVCGTTLAEPTGGKGTLNGGGVETGERGGTPGVRPGPQPMRGRARRGAPVPRRRR